MMYPRWLGLILVPLLVVAVGGCTDSHHPGELPDYRQSRDATRGDTRVPDVDREKPVESQR